MADLGKGYTLSVSGSYSQTDKQKTSGKATISVTATISSTNTNWTSSYPSTLQAKVGDSVVGTETTYGFGQWNSISATGSLEVSYNASSGQNIGISAYFDKGSTTSAYAPSSGSEWGSVWVPAVSYGTPSFSSGPSVSDITTESLKVSWGANAGSYTSMSQQTARISTDGGSTIKTSINNSPATFTGLTHNTDYWYSVYLKNSAGKTKTSAWTKTTTKGDPPVITVQPELIIKSKTISVKTTDMQETYDTNASFYSTRMDIHDTNNVWISSKTSNIHNDTLVSDNLLPNTEYFVYVLVADNFGNSTILTYKVKTKSDMIINGCYFSDARINNKEVIGMRLNNRDIL